MGALPVEDSSAVNNTSEKIAKLAGCSAATVSRVLNNSAPVSRQTREAVLRAMRETGVVPRRRTRTQIQNGAHITGHTEKSSRLVEVVMHLTSRLERVDVNNGDVKLGPIAPCPADQFFKPENRYSNSFFRRIFDGVVDELSRWQMRPVLRTTNTLDDRQLLADINDSGNAGLIIMGNQSPEMESFLSACRCPVVSFIDQDHHRWPPTVASDDLPGLREAVKHLMSLGHTRIGYIACRQDSPAFRDRFTAFRLAMIEAGLTLRSDWFYDQSTHIADIAAGAQKILAMADRPTAIMCCYDGAALGVTHAAAHLGLRVPEDVSVVGFGDQAMIELVRPALTTVHVPTYDMGSAGVRLLVMQQTARDITNGLCARLPTTLTIRSSTAPPNQRPSHQISGSP